MLVKLRVNQATFDDIMNRIVKAGQPYRFIPGGIDGTAIDVNGIALVVDKKDATKAE